MPIKEANKIDYWWIAGLMFVALLLRLATNGKYGFHRDEFLYISQGQNLDWGFWSNPPGPGFFSWLTQTLLGDSLFAVRFVPAILGVLTVGLTCLIAREMKGGLFAQMLAGGAVIFSSSMPRVFLMYNPVPFEVFYWTLSAFLLIKYLNTTQGKYLILLGIAIGMGMLNKYSMVLFVLPTIVVLALSVKHRAIFLKRELWLATIIVAIIVLPNLLWQWSHNFPVLGHMSELRQNQLSNVRLKNFLLDQLLFNASILIIWIPGLWYLFRHERGRTSRPIGWIFILIIFLIAALKGKSYYTLGAFPIVFASGACIWEYWTRNRRWVAVFPILIVIIGFQAMAPFSVPYLAVEKMVDFGKDVSARGLDGMLRWEDGEIHHLPQDYADMLGWDELTDLVVKAVDQIEDSSDYLIYCENFGQTGAVNYYGKKVGLKKAVSFADAFAFWAPAEISSDIDHFIYVNDELGDDIQSLFTSIQQVGQVEHPYARERLTQVFLCHSPNFPFADFWKERVNSIWSERNIERN